MTTSAPVTVQPLTRLALAQAICTPPVVSRARTMEPSFAAAVFSLLF